MQHIFRHRISVAHFNSLRLNFSFDNEELLDKNSSRANDFGWWLVFVSLTQGLKEEARMLVMNLRCSPAALWRLWSMAL